MRLSISTGKGKNSQSKTGFILIYMVTLIDQHFNRHIPKLEVELGPPGEVTISVKRVRGARAYMHQYATEAPTSETVWINVGHTFPYNTFRGLKSFNKYWFRIVALGPNGQMVYSPFEARIVQ